jgi:hypothetical protein
MKMQDEVTPDMHHNQARAIVDDEKKRQKRVEENKKMMEETLTIRIGRNLFTIRTYLGGEK